MALLEYIPNPLPVQVVIDTLGFGSSAVTELEQAENVNEYNADPFRARIKKYRHDLLLNPIFEKVEQKVLQMAGLGTNWDSYGAAPPNIEARRAAKEVLFALKKGSLAPSTVVPSSEGGVAICFVEAGAYADIECLNTGEILAVTYKDKSEPNVWEVSPEPESLGDTVIRIRGHFGK